MSNNIGEFKSIDSDESMIVTAFVGKDWDASVQFTIGSDTYSTVTSKYVKCMILNLENKSHSPSIITFNLGVMATHNGIVISTSERIKYTWFEIGNKRVKLDEKQRNKLIRILQKRIDGVEGYRATD